MKNNESSLNKLIKNIPGISLPEDTGNNIKKIVKMLASTNDQVVALMEQDEHDALEVKKINAEIKLIAKKLYDRKKELKSNKKNRTEMKLMLLGERESFRKILVELGAQVDKKQFNNIAVNSAAKPFELKEA